MTLRDQDGASNEIVIIRRRAAAGDDGHHGGAWKIAFADFMTAMMAFFLVMWLVNATNKKTLAEIAQYFNPVKLSDRAPIPKGLRQDDSEAAKPVIEGADPVGRSVGPVVSRFVETTDEALFRDPYGVLAHLARVARIEIVEASGAGVESHARHAVDRPAVDNTVRDPFDPAFGPSPRGADEGARDPGGPNEARSAGPSDTAAGEAALKAAERDHSTRASVAPDRDLERIDAEIRKVLADFKQGRTPDVEVLRTSEGILIRLTDNSSYGMFAIASAEPRPELILFLEQIGRVLASHQGGLIMRGHTDGRPFRPGTYDNWRLSSARAQMAYYMLVRGGVDEARFERIEGHADRDLRVKADPTAARNRRIEILLRGAPP